MCGGVCLTNALPERAFTAVSMKDSGGWAGQAASIIEEKQEEQHEKTLSFYVLICCFLGNYTEKWGKK